MEKILFISGSARNGNCKMILENLQKNFWLDYSTDVVFIRDYNVAECMGCNACETQENTCVIDDRMDVLLDKVKDANIVVLATPNYFYNVSGLTKMFIDRTKPCYKEKLLKDKKFIYIYVGGDSTQNTKKYLDNAMYGFSVCQEVSVLGSFAFSASNIGEFKEPTNAKDTIQEIANLIRKNLTNQN